MEKNIYQKPNKAWCSALHSDNPQWGSLVRRPSEDCRSLAAAGEAAPVMAPEAGGSCDLGWQAQGSRFESED